MIVTLCILYSVFCIVRLFPVSIPEMYESIWSIKLPEHLELIYDIHTPVSFHGDGERYTVFKVQEDFKMQENRKKDTQKKAEQEKFALEILEALDVSKEERPNFNKNYIGRVYTKNKDKLFIMYFIDSNYFYLFQHLQ